MILMREPSSTGNRASWWWNLLEAQISALRQKLRDRERRLIRTVRGVGYALSG
jgi:DNA-binding response OmpR family regulator